MGGPGEQLRRALDGPDLVVMPTVYNGMSAQIVARTGFPVASLGGSAVTNTLMGMPDAGFITLTEMEFLLRRVVGAAPELPIVVDIDNGYGNALQAMNAVRVLESLGAAGVMLDDQTVPPRCPNKGGADVVSVEEAVGKVRAAADARRDRDFFIIGRTDSLHAEGLDAAIQRVNRYVDAGADCAFVAEPLTRDELERVGREVKAPYKMVNLGGGFSKDRLTGYDLTFEGIKALGFDLATVGINTVRVGAMALHGYLEDLKARGIEAERDLNRSTKGTIFRDWFAFTGLDEASELERRYVPARAAGPTPGARSDPDPGGVP